jgi:hypothetical protein
VILEAVRVFAFMKKKERPGGAPGKTICGKQSTKVFVCCFFSKDCK